MKNTKTTKPIEYFTATASEFIMWNPKQHEGQGQTYEVTLEAELNVLSRQLTVEVFYAQQDIYGDITDTKPITVTLNPLPQIGVSEINHYTSELYTLYKQNWEKELQSATEQLDPNEFDYLFTRAFTSLLAEINLKDLYNVKPQYWRGSLLYSNLVGNINITAQHVKPKTHVTNIPHAYAIYQIEIGNNLVRSTDIMFLTEWVRDLFQDTYSLADKWITPPAEAALESFNQGLQSLWEDAHQTYQLTRDTK